MTTNIPTEPVTREQITDAMLAPLRARVAAANLPAAVFATQWYGADFHGHDALITIGAPAAPERGLPPRAPHDAVGQPLLHLDRHGNITD